MLNKVGRSITISALLCSTFLLLGGGSSAMWKQNEEALNNKCIGCHMEVSKKSMESLHVHRPCFERQCIVCHLAPESDWRTQEEGGASATTTGAPVADQGDKWRKTLVFSVTEGLQTKHVVALTGLPESKAYRFRIVLSNNPKPRAGTQQASKWLGLVPTEAQEFSASSEQIFDIKGLATDAILTASIQRMGKALWVRWQSRSESFGWVELQDVEGVSLQQLDAKPVTKKTGDQTTAKRGKENHPLLVSSEYATIDLCYTCHPQTRMGTSHPVRIYSKQNQTRIPENLPTGKGGMLTCVTCHEPHGGKGKAMVRDLITTRLCVACHYTFNRSSKSTMF